MTGVQTCALPIWLITSGVNKTLGVGNQNFTFNFSSAQLSQVSYNYSIRIYDSEVIQIFERNKIITKWHTLREKSQSPGEINGELITKVLLLLSRNVPIVEPQYFYTGFVPSAVTTEENLLSRKI